MKKGNRANVLLVELLIVVLFFALSSTVLVDIFTAARLRGDRAENIDAALAQAQTVADRLILSENADETLDALGFSDGARDYDGFTLTVSHTQTQSASGVYLSGEVVAYVSGEIVATLPVAHYIPKEAAQ